MNVPDEFYYEIAIKRLKEELQEKNELINKQANIIVQLVKNLNEISEVVINLKNNSLTK